MNVSQIVPCETITETIFANTASKNKSLLADMSTRKSIKCDKPREGLSHPVKHRPPPRKMSDTSNPVYFLHVGKSGGTSIDDLLENILKCQPKKYIGDLHYDWSYIQHRELPRIKGVRHHHYHRDAAAAHDDDDDGLSSIADVITFLRHPISRAVSQFYFSKRLKWAKKANATFLHQTFDEYIDDIHKDWFQPIADGESGTDFLAGIFPTDEGHWVASDQRESEMKVYLRKNRTAACLVAAKRLESTPWFGMMEDIDRSMKLLQISLGLKFAPVLPKTNGSGRRNPQPSAATIKKVEKHVQKDLWLYEYAQSLFEARWNYFMGDNCRYISPELPPLPDFS